MESLSTIFARRVESLYLRTAAIIRFYCSIFMMSKKKDWSTWVFFYRTNIFLQLSPYNKFRTIYGQFTEIVCRDRQGSFVSQILLHNFYQISQTHFLNSCYLHNRVNIIHDISQITSFKFLMLISLYT